MWMWFRQRDGNQLFSDLLSRRKSIWQLVISRSHDFINEHRLEDWLQDNWHTPV